METMEVVIKKTSLKISHGFMAETGVRALGEPFH